MSDWQPGDLALCVANYRDHGPRGGRLTVGRCYRVARVTPPSGWRGNAYGVGLIIEGPANSPNPDWFHERFRKVTPPEADEFDRETIALMNGAPVRETA